MSEAVQSLPFPTFAALREEHGSLLKRFEAAGVADGAPLPDGLIAEIQDMLGRVNATGVQLSFASDRSDAQSIFSHWSRILRTKGIEPQVRPLPYPSLTALRAEHLNLLKRLDALEAAENTVLPDALIADVQELIGRAKATGIKLSFAADRSDAQSVLTYWTSVLRNKGLPVRTALLSRFDQAQAIRSLGGRSPYKGLRPFQQEDADLFFGRRELVAEMVRILGARRLLTVLGISGSGKSSTVRAGLLPALLDDAIPGSKDWLYIPTFVPGPDPLNTLASALRPPEMGASSSTETMATFRNSPKTLLNLLTLRSRPTVLVIDQFEEAFTLTLAEADRDALFANLAAVLTEPGCRHSLVLTMRSEFDSLLSQTALRPYLADSRIRVPSLQATELRDAIERPAERFGVHLDPGVVQSLIKNVLNEPAGLPLLEFALMKLWQSQENQTITCAAYEALGGTPQQILVKAADESLTSFNLPEDQDRCRLLFLRLVRTGDTLEVTSRRRTLEDIRSIEIEHIERLLSKLEPDGLLRVTPAEPRGRSTVEVSHESLTRNWPQLVQWVRDDLTRLRRRELLEETVAQWKKNPQKVTLYSGGQLDEALEFPDLSKLEQDFLARSSEASKVTKRERVGVRVTVPMLVMAAGFGIMIWLQNRDLVKAHAEAEKAKQDLADTNKQLQQTLESLSLMNLTRTLPTKTQQRLQVDKTTVYLQIPDEKYRELARHMTTALKTSRERPILPGIQRLDPTKVNFPIITQLRYFRPDDEPVAQALVEDLALLDKVTPVLIGADALGPDRIKSLPPYLFELWIGTGVVPPPPSKPSAKP